MAVTYGLKPIEDLACSIAEHRDGVVRWSQNRISNGVLEAISSVIQAAKRRARLPGTDGAGALPYRCHVRV